MQLRADPRGPLLPGDRANTRRDLGRELHETLLANREVTSFLLVFVCSEEQYRIYLDPYINREMIQRIVYSKRAVAGEKVITIILTFLNNTIYLNSNYKKIYSYKLV